MLTCGKPNPTGRAKLLRGGPEDGNIHAETRSASLENPWKKTNREIRALLSSMAPARAAQAVRLVGLPPDEETAVLAVDVHGQSCLQAAALLHVSVDGLAKIRRRAYAKIADDMQG